MSGDPVAAYQDALLSKRQQEGNLRDTFNIIRTFVQNANTSGWGGIIVDGVEMPVLSKNSPHFNPQSWPTGQQIVDMILQWHKLDLKVRNAWDQVPKERRTGLSPPTQPT